MGSWWAFCIQKEGLEFGRKMKGIFGLILYAPSWARKRRLYYLWLLSGASKPSQGFSPFLKGKSIFFRKKEKALPEPSCSRVFVLRSNIIWGPGFWNLAFISETLVGHFRYQCNDTWDKMTHCYSYIYLLISRIRNMWSKHFRMNGNLHVNSVTV